MTIPSFGSDNVRDFLLAIMALSTFGTAVITGWTKRAQRKRDEKKAKLDAEVAEALAKRDRMKAEFDTAVAAKVQEVADTAVRAANEVQGVKTALATNTDKTTKAIGEVKDEVHESKTVVDKVHIIVNSEKTRMMEELLASRSLTLSMARALVKSDPTNKDAQIAMNIAQTLYDKLAAEVNKKEQADDKVGGR